MTGRIFLKLIAGVLCLLLLALVTVDYSASEVARETNIQNLMGNWPRRAACWRFRCRIPRRWESKRRGEWRAPRAAASP